MSDRALSFKTLRAINLLLNLVFLWVFFSFQSQSPILDGFFSLYLMRCPYHYTIKFLDPSFSFFISNVEHTSPIFVIYIMINSFTFIHISIHLDPSKHQ